MNIAPIRIDRLADRLAHLTSEDAETAVARVIEERLCRVGVPGENDRREALQEIFNRAARMPALDARSIDEIMDYGPDEPPS
jgi:hypothetical protein